MLKSKRLITALFDKGIRLNKYPFKLILLPLDSADDDAIACKILISVSARKFRKATDRNRIKRIIREVYRRNKNIIYSYLTENNRKCALAIMYNGSEIPTFDQVEKVLIPLLRRLPDVYEKIVE